MFLFLWCFFIFKKNIWWWNFTSCFETRPWGGWSPIMLKSSDTKGCLTWLVFKLLSKEHEKDKKVTLSQLPPWSAICTSIISKWAGILPLNWKWFGVHRWTPVYLWNENSSKENQAIKWAKYHNAEWFLATLIWWYYWRLSMKSWIAYPSSELLMRSQWECHSQGACSNCS